MKRADGTDRNPLSPGSRLVGLLILASACTASRTLAIEPALLKESQGNNDQDLLPGCPIASNLNGSCGNFRWYNICTGYIWIQRELQAGEAVGVRFDDSCVVGGGRVKRTITYFRNVDPGYNQTVDVHLDVDTNNDGCPDYTLASAFNMDPGLRWNCSTFNATIPVGAQALIVRQVHDGGLSPTFATDGPFTESCDPTGSPHSYYYGINGSACLPWTGPTSRNDNFLTWLIVDRPCVPMIADFEAADTVGPAPLSVQFSDRSTCDPTAWEWDFDNNGSIDADVKNPVHTYTKQGTYSVMLRVANAVAADTVLKPSYISVLPAGTAVETGATPSMGVRLHPNDPNPFGLRTSIAYDLGDKAVVTLRIYDPSGRLVRNLVSGVVQGPGRFLASWDGRDEGGTRAGPGVYIYRLEAGQWVESRSMVLLK